MDATERCRKWKSFCCLFNVSLILVLSGSIVFILLYPLIRTISSTMSIGWVISGLQVGIIKSNSEFFLDISNPRSVKIFIISLSFTLKPVIFSNKEILNLIFVFLLFVVFCILNLLILPPQISEINWAAFVKPISIDWGSIPLSNLNFASVSIFNSFEVFL